MHDWNFTRLDQPGAREGEQREQERATDHLGSLLNRSDLYRLHTSLPVDLLSQECDQVDGFAG